jgi:uncharacterized Rmd1/YagE family protein
MTTSTAKGLPVRAVSFASTLPSRDLALALPNAEGTIWVGKTRVVASYEGDRWIVGYDFGAIVFVNVDAAQQKTVLEAYARGAKDDRETTDESLVLVVDPAAAPETRFDRVVVPRLSREVVEIVCFVLAQSAAMEYYERDVDQIFDGLGKATRQIADQGNFRGSERALLKFVGSAMLTRNEIISTLALLDTPQLAWNSEPLDKLFRELRDLFEIEDRYRALDHKLTVVQDNLALFVDLTQQRRGLFLEVTVLILIAVEVVLFVWQVVKGH